MEKIWIETEFMREVRTGNGRAARRRRSGIPDAVRWEHIWPRVFARNMVFCHDLITSDDTRNRAELWGVMIHFESSSKANTSNDDTEA